MFNKITDERWKIYRDIHIFLELEVRRLKSKSRAIRNPVLEKSNPLLEGKWDKELQDLSIRFGRIALELESTHNRRSDSVGRFISDDVITMKG